ncbi:MAG: RnfABCDGE type electron transport complex subunit B [Spirochaetota bacterium]|nr:RnfABCDGE type electron transport complex subunit B [Spirochaetota bacterium]
MFEIIFPSISSVIIITSIGIVFGFMLSTAKLVLNVERDPRFALVLEALPNANCGACGEAGCAGYAAKIVDSCIAPNLCPVGGSEVTNTICSIMGIEAEFQKPKTARVACQGGNDVALTEFIYNGPKSCLAAEQIMGGFKVCQYGCLGLGDCERSCPFNAIYINKNGIPQVNKERCTGCGNCISACPRGIIRLVDSDFDVYVLCKNREKGRFVKQGCSVGCIACKKCEKACREVFADNSDIDSAIEVINFLTVIDYNKCINCGKCAEVCPQNVIKYIDKVI